MDKVLLATVNNEQIVVKASKDAMAAVDKEGQGLLDGAVAKAFECVSQG